MGLRIGNINFKCFEELHNWHANSQEKYFGIYPDLDTNDQAVLIKELTENGFYKRHPYADARLKGLKPSIKNPLNKFFIEYYVTKEFIDDIFNFLNDRYVYSTVSSHASEIEMVTKTNLKYLNSKEDKLKRICSKINHIYNTEDDITLYYLSLYNNDQSDIILEGFSKMDIAQSFGGSTRVKGEFNEWYKIYHNYLKGDSPRPDEIPGIKEWRRIASIDLELKYYLELQVRMEELIKKDYFNSISHIKIYDRLSVYDSNLLNQIVPILKYKIDLEIIEKILFDHNDRDSAFFNNLFKYFFNIVPKRSRFKTADNISFQNIIKKCYPHLRDFTINSNSLSRRMERSFKNLDPYDENDEN